MFAQSTLLFTTLVLGALASVSQAALTLKAPASMSMCDTVDLTPSGGVAPYTITVYKSCDDSNDDDDDKPITEFRVANSSGVSWMTNIAEHQNVQIALTDAKGDVFYTDDMTVKTSKIGSCVGKPTQFTYLNLAEGPATSATGSPTTQVPAAPAATIGAIAPPVNDPSSNGQGVGAVGASTKSKSGASSTAASFGLIALVSFGAIFVGTW